MLADRSIRATLYELPDVSWIAIAVDENNFMMDLHPGIEPGPERSDAAAGSVLGH